MATNKKQSIKLTIDGVDVEVEKGRTILEAAQAAGVRIPTLCHDRRLIPFGACRLCVVQQKGKSELLPSCFTPAKGGMEIVTRSTEIDYSRRLQLQLILLNHPMICPRCEKEGECDLQTLVYEYGVEETLYPWERAGFPSDERSHLIQRNGDRCILCGRCVRICDEVQGVGELSFTRRGVQTAIDTDFHRPIECEFCGQCLDTCPVGAITTDRFDYKTKAWEMKETTTPCPYCGCGCHLALGSQKAEIKRVSSFPEKGPNDGNLCVKGRFGLDFVDHPARLLSPLLRVNGTLKEVSWEEALQSVVQDLETLKAEYGPEAIAGRVSNRLTNEEYYLLKKLFRETIGTNTIHHQERSPCRVLTDGLAKTMGVPASTSSIQEIRDADCILVIGTDPGQTHPIIKNEMHLAIRRNRAQLIVLSSYQFDLFRATQWSPLSPPCISLLDRPGREMQLLNAMVHTILKEGLENKPFIEEKTEGINELREGLEALRDEGGGEGSGPAKQEMEQAARAFATAKKAMILIGSGYWSNQESRKIALAASNLALITGQVGKPSCGILVLLDKCNTQGAIDMGAFIESEEEGWAPLFRKAEEGRVKALYLIGEDPVFASPVSAKQALEKVPLLIVQDLFLTETAKMARVVLPASSFAEKGGTFTNLERRVQSLNPLRPPLGQSKSDFDIFLELLRRFESPVPGETEEAVFEEITRSIPFYKDIRDGDQWPKGSPYLYGQGFPLGKAKLIPVGGNGTKPGREDYPFQMIQRPSLFASGLLGEKSDALKRVSEKPYLEMNPEDALKHQIEEGETVEVLTVEGRSLKLQVKYSSKPFPGVILVPFPSPLTEEKGIASVRVEKLK